VDSRGSYGLGITALENQTGPSVAGAIGTAFYSFIINGRLHVRYSYAHAQSTTLKELSGGLGQQPGNCVLTLSCIREATIAGDADAWYVAMVEAAGCITVERGSRTDYKYLGPCFRYNTFPQNAQIHIRGGKPTVVFREGTILYVVEWNGTAWISVGQGTGGPTTTIRTAASDGKLAVLTMAPAGTSPRIHVDVFDGTEWTSYPDGIETSGANVTDVDVAIHHGTPAVGLIENGKLVVRWFIPPPGAAVVR
jgi:hypothetical protein